MRIRQYWLGNMLIWYDTKKVTQPSPDPRPDRLPKEQCYNVLPAAETAVGARTSAVHLEAAAGGRAHSEAEAGSDGRRVERRSSEEHSAAAAASAHGRRRPPHPRRHGEAAADGPVGEGPAGEAGEEAADAAHERPRLARRSSHLLE